MRWLSNLIPKKMNVKDESKKDVYLKFDTK
jgi:hypothetical protein